MEYHENYDRAKGMQERAMELILIQVESVIDELEQLSMLVEEVEDEVLREKIDAQVAKVMGSLDRI